MRFGLRQSATQRVDCLREPRTYARQQGLSARVAAQIPDDSPIPAPAKLLLDAQCIGIGLLQNRIYVPGRN